MGNGTNAPTIAVPSSTPFDAKASRLNCLQFVSAAEAHAKLALHKNSVGCTISPT